MNLKLKDLKFLIVEFRVINIINILYKERNELMCLIS